MKFLKSKAQSLLVTSVCALTCSGVFSSTASAASTFVNLQILMEGAVGTGTMRTDLWDRGLLDTVQNPQPPQSPCNDMVFEQIDVGTAPSSQTTPVDWVCVELRDAIDPAIVRFNFNGIVLRNGLIRRSDGSIPVVPLTATQYYVVVRHKSHLPIASEITPITNNQLFVNFRSEPTGPFGGAHQVLVGGGWAMIAGNPNQDNSVELRQINGADLATWSQNNGPSNVYMSADVNLDGDVNGADKVSISNNNGLFSMIPF